MKIYFAATSVPIQVTQFSNPNTTIIVGSLNPNTTIIVGSLVTPSPLSLYNLILIISR